MSHQSQKRNTYKALKRDRPDPNENRWPSPVGWNANIHRNPGTFQKKLIKNIMKKIMVEFMLEIFQN